MSDRYICAVCGGSFPADVMYSFSPGGLVHIHECSECHDRGINSVDLRRHIRVNKIRSEAKERSL